MKKMLVLTIMFLMLSVSQVFSAELFEIYDLGKIDTGTEYSVFIDAGIGHPALYRELFIFFRDVKEGDVVTVRLATGGGWLSTSMMLYNAILDCKAKTIADIYMAYSGGAMIAMACEDIKLNKFSRMMFHSAGWGSISFSGNVKQIKKTVDRFSNRSDEITIGVFKGFLSESELDKVLNGEDIFLSGEDLKNRVRTWKRVNIKYRDFDKLLKLNKKTTDAEEKKKLEDMLQEKEELEKMLKNILNYNKQYK